MAAPATALWENTTVRSLVLVVALLLAAPAARAQTAIADRAWARATPPYSPSGTVYLSINAGTADRLIGAHTAVATTVEIRETVHDNGIVHTREAEGGVALEPARVKTLAPGGYHLMLMGLKEQLRVGHSFEITLTFAVEPPVTVIVYIRAAGAPAGNHLPHS